MSKKHQRWTWTGGLEEANRRHPRGHWEDGGQTWVEKACDDPVSDHLQYAGLIDENDELRDKLAATVSKRVAISACIGSAIIGFILGLMARLFLFG